MTDKELVTAAKEARTFAYAPYSHFAVGAALLCTSGKVYTGCNIENASFTPTNCAERTAIFKAVSDGERSFAAIAVAGGAEGIEPSFCSPCGVCRQVLAEFCPPDFCILIATGGDNFCKMTLQDLLPHAFLNTM